MYYTGDGVIQDYTQAVFWYRKAAEQGNVLAQFALGVMYETGHWFHNKSIRPCSLGVSYDSCHRPFAQSSGINPIGACYDTSRGVAQSCTQAVFWYRKAAEQGLADAQNNLGTMYRDGLGVAQEDYTEAVFWYRKAAEQGLAKAQNNLASMYQGGLGGTQDSTQAVFWYRKAAKQGLASAQYSLGMMYEQGDGIAQNYAQAIFWYRKAAEQGDADAQFSLGDMYYAGHGVAQDDTQAEFWWRKAEDIYGQCNLGRDFEDRSEAAVRVIYGSSCNLGWTDEDVREVSQIPHEPYSCSVRRLRKGIPKPKDILIE